MPRLRSFAPFLLLLIPAAAAPGSLWVVPVTEGRTIREAWEAGAGLLDRFPRALVTADESSAAAMDAAGFPVYGPFAPEGGIVTLFHVPDDNLPDLDLDALLDREDIRVLWSDGRAALVRSDLPIPETTGIGLERKPLRTRPLVQPEWPPPHLDRTEIRESRFGATIESMADQVDSTTYMTWIGDLSGAHEVIIDGDPFLITTRHTAYAPCDSAERFIYESFLAMGFTDVRFDPFEFDGIDGRNVIATLPGITRPDENIILCGHLDGTSPNPHILAPAANDNGSGTAAVLTAAKILREHSFEKTIRFIAFSGEEQGLRGSAHYAMAAADSGMEIDAVVNCDMVARHRDENKIRIQGNWYTFALMGILEEAFRVFTDLDIRLQYSSGGSDHVAFQNAGYNAVMAIEDEYWRYPCYHQFCDVVGRNHWEFGVSVTRAVTAATAYLAHLLPDGEPFATAVPEAAPGHTIFADARPNPFNPATTVRWELPAPMPVDVAIFDGAGKLVKLLARQSMNAGAHELVWNGKDRSGRQVPSGVYFLRVKAGDARVTRKLTLLR